MSASRNRRRWSARIRSSASNTSRRSFRPPPAIAVSNGWVELEFTVRTDGSTADIVVTNSNPRRTFDAAARNAISQWRYKPVARDGKAVDQRVAVRIRFSD